MNLSSHENPSGNRGGAFTIVELMVSIAVLILLLLLVTQLINSAASVTTGGNKRMDADSQARLVFDRMAVDFSKIVNRTDVDYYLNKTTGNDQMAFYSQATGYYPSGLSNSTPKSNVSLVGYRINGDNQLERLGKGLIWNGVTSSTSGASGLSSSDMPIVFLPRTLVGTWPNIAGNGSDPDYQVIGEQVFRMELCFLLKSFTDLGGNSQPAILSETAWDTRQGHTAADGLADVSAVVVTIAVLDTTSRNIVKPAELNTAAAKFADFDGVMAPAKAWQATVDGGDLGLPQAAASQVRIYQRYFYLNPIQ